MSVEALSYATASRSQQLAIARRRGGHRVLRSMKQIRRRLAAVFAGKERFQFSSAHVADWRRLISILATPPTRLLDGESRLQTLRRHFSQDDRQLLRAAAARGVIDARVRTLVIDRLNGALIHPSLIDGVLASIPPLPRGS